MPSKVKELEPRRSGDRGACPICCPKPDRISESRLWEWAEKEFERTGDTVLPLR